MQGLQGFFAAQGLHGLHGLHGFVAAQGLHGLQRTRVAAQGLQALAAQGLQGLQPAAIWIGVSAAWATAIGRAIAAVAKVATLSATTDFLIIKASKSISCRRFGVVGPGGRKT